MSSNKNEQTMPVMPSISVFGVKPPDALLVPDMPINVRNNCQIGQWVIGDAAQGSKCSMTVLKFAKYFGDIGESKRTQWGQLWFVAESGDLPKGIVLVTYIKSRGLENFSTLVAGIQSTGVEPATGIFTPEFVSHSGQKPDMNGVPRPVNYYSLKWSWKAREPHQYDSLQQAANVLTDPNLVSKLVDINGTRQLIQIDGLSSERLARLLANENPNDAVGALPEAQLNALLGAANS